MKLNTYASSPGLTKAFDCVSLDILLEKLKYHSFDDHSMSLIRSNLLMQAVCFLRTECLCLKCFICVVPQGSVLCPLLFLICVNNLPCFQDYSNLFLLADDTTCFTSYRPTEIDISLPCRYANIVSPFLTLSDSEWAMFTTA